MERLEQRIDTLTELVNTLVTTLSQNAANVALAIPSGIPLANVEGKEVHLLKGRDATASEARTDTHARRRRTQRRHYDAT